VKLAADAHMYFEAYDRFTPEEQLRLTPFFSNLDRPVFAVRNLPEAVKAALFARYSRYPGTLRRLFLEEFASDAWRGLPHAAAEPGSERAEKLFDTVFLGYGDDSVAQLGGAHIACEWSSNLLTKILERPRLAAYLEQSTRYIAFDQPIAAGHYRYRRDDGFGDDYHHAMDEIFDTYSRAIGPVSAWVAERFRPRGLESEAAYHRAVRAKSLDLLRGLLPASTLSHVGIFASAQTLELLILHLAAHPLTEARDCGEMMEEAVSAVLPSFMRRVRRPDRGGLWIEHLRSRARLTAEVAAELGLDEPQGRAGPSVRLIEARGNETELLAAMLVESSSMPETKVRERVEGISEVERARLIRVLSGTRADRRHRPNRGFEELSYRFEIVADYGAFRDLQRHRLLTVQWQELTGDLGADVPEEVIAAGQGDNYARALEISYAEWRRLRQLGAGPAAAYALCLAFRIRFTIDLNAREAMHLIELRSGVQGHASYRAVALEMHRLIGQVHPAVAVAMNHVDDSEEPRLERLLSEMRKGEPS